MNTANRSDTSINGELEEMRRLATVVSDSNDAVIMHDFDGKILAWNRGAKETYGYMEAEALGKNVRDIVAEEDREAALALIKRIKEGDIVKSFELKRITKDGRILDVWLTTTLLTDEKGKPVAIATTERDITERKRSEEQLIIAKEKAEESNQLKSSLLSNLSHEIRTPMNAIMGFSRLMAEANEDDKNSYADIIQNSAKHLLALIDDIILLSRLQSEKMSLNSIAFNPSDLITDVYQIFKFTDLKKGLDIEVRIPEQNLIIQSDANKIRQVLINLVSNAVKYTLEGRVQIGFDLKDGFIEYYVKDTGIGVPEQELHRIFETFYRSEGAIFLAIGGIGLGLCIAKELVELLHGEIGVTSEPNKGSRFYFTIPFEQSEQRHPERHLHQTSQKNLKDISILIADDEPINF
jgi:PAS domain S-box-containing protein